MDFEQRMLSFYSNKDLAETIFNELTFITPHGHRKFDWVLKDSDGTQIQIESSIRWSQRDIEDYHANGFENMKKIENAVEGSILTRTLTSTWKTRYESKIVFKKIKDDRWRIIKYEFNYSVD